VSKRVLAEATTTLHTQVSTQVYGAPEVLGTDSNSKTSNYTNSVDIWSLGCVRYELLVGAKLFISERQLSGYFYGKWPFPEDKLKRLSPPIDDIGISFLKSMLLIQPEDRPTAAGALSHGWLAGLKNDDKDSGDDQDKTAQCLGVDGLGWSGGKQLANCDVPKKSHSERSPVTQEDTRCILGEAVLSANAQSERGGHATTPGAIIDSYAITQLDVTSPESSSPQMGPQKPELMPRSLQANHSAGRGTKILRRKQIRTIPQPCSQSSTPNTKPNPHIKGVANESWISNFRAPASDPPTADPNRGNSFQSTPETNGEMEHVPERMHRTPASILDETEPRVAHVRTYHARRGISG